MPVLVLVSTERHYLIQSSIRILIDLVRFRFSALRDISKVIKCGFSVLPYHYKAIILWKSLGRGEIHPPPSRLYRYPGGSDQIGLIIIIIILIIFTCNTHYVFQDCRTGP